MRAVALIGLILLGAVSSAWMLLPEAFPDLQSRAPSAAPARPALAPAAPPTAPQAAAPAPAAPAPGPRFDVARVGARGMLVTAGRAAPGAEVMLLEGGHELGRARADARGEWVILPTEPLTPGLRELSLSARLAGQDQVAGAETVVVVVPEQPAASSVSVEAATGAPAETTSLAAVGRGLPARGQAAGAALPGALALLLPPAGADAAPRVLQTPAARQSRLSVEVVDYDQAGAMRFAGSAAPGAMVRLYVGGTHVGDAMADQAGRWVLAPTRQPGFGRHLLRADQVGAHGEVVARVEVPFQRDELPQEMLRDGRVVVQPGHSLWRLARLAYGRGVRYTVIYEANREQIREPSLIYPGQVFALPGEQH